MTLSDGDTTNNVTGTQNNVGGNQYVAGGNIIINNSDGNAKPQTIRVA